MAADLDMKTVLKYAAMAVAAYLVWDRIISPMLSDGRENDVVAGSGGDRPAVIPTTGSGVTNTVGSANAGNGTPAVTPNVSTAANVLQNNAEAKLADKLQALAGSVKLLDVNGWNYYMRELNPNAVTTDLFEVGIGQGPLMSVAQYLNKRAEAGLSVGSMTSERHGGVDGYFLN